ncbi:MAG TPA: aminotransferase class V-fold PLP-dependent enzyme [Thermoanaerobaculia bacterium]|jgi:kynureninase|nr:aminotransferase class V-fold PLP-dependent enzyme [Thermoanaerobaculia bacterium]
MPISPSASTALTAAAALDRDDPLARFRVRFLLPVGMRYFDGNSLGALAQGVAERVARVATHEWGEGLIGSWTSAGWLELPKRVAARLAPFLGVGADEVAVADGTSVNLFKLLGAALQARPGRKRVLALAGNFPTDLYVARAAAEQHGAAVETFAAGDLAAAIDGRTAVVTLSHVDYRTGEVFDLAALAAAAHRQGALLLVDVSHSVGAMPLLLGEWRVDLAVGCGYKFLGGGPGAPAFLVVRRELQESLRSPLPGWLGHANPFAFADGYEPAPGVDRFLCGTPPILSLSALDAALEAWEGIDLRAVRDWSASLGDAFIALADAHLAPLGVTVASPRDAARRGAQVSLRHPRAQELIAALAARGIVGDFRPPDLLRFGLHALYVRHADVVALVEALAGLLADPPEPRR